MNNKRKNIIILGCQRSGKTTLTNLLCKKDNSYSIISGDCLLFAFENSMPETGLKVSSSIESKSPRFVDFLSYYLTGFKRSYKGQNYIIESCQILPKDLKKNPFFNDAEVICLGFPNATVDEIFHNIRLADSKPTNAYTKNLSDDALKQRIHEWINYSKYLEKACKRNNIPFFETDKNRDEVLNNIVKTFQSPIHSSPDFEEK